MFGLNAGRMLEFSGSVCVVRKPAFVFFACFSNSSFFIIEEHVVFQQTLPRRLAIVSDEILHKTLNA
jgi:hypothetical protein